MSERLLLEYIALLTEKIRSNKVDGDKFNMRTFQQLPDAQAAVQYANKHLQMLGRGSARGAWLLNSRQVVKVALSSKGNAQNEAEVDVYTNPESQPVVAKIYASDKSFNWIISDLVRPIKSVEEFQQLSGLSWQSFRTYIYDNVKQRTMPKRAPEFVKRIIDLAHKNKLLRGDLAQADVTRNPSDDVLGHYGKTPDGRLVLLDYGATEGVWKQNYANAPKATPQDKKTEPDREEKTGAAAPDAKKKAAANRSGEEEKTNPEPATKPARRLA